MELSQELIEALGSEGMQAHNEIIRLAAQQKALARAGRILRKLDSCTLSEFEEQGCLQHLVDIHAEATLQGWR
jgi:hypothetical protein